MDSQNDRQRRLMNPMKMRTESPDCYICSPGKQKITTTAARRSSGACMISFSSHLSPRNQETWLSPPGTLVGVRSLHLDMLRPQQRCRDESYQPTLTPPSGQTVADTPVSLEGVRRPRLQLGKGFRRSHIAGQRCWTRFRVVFPIGLQEYQTII